MKKELTAALFIAGVFGGVLHGKGFQLATELDRKRLSAEVRETASVAGGPPISGDERWDNYSEPMAAPSQGAPLYKVMSMATRSTNPEPPSVKTPPTSVTVTEGDTVTLRVVTSGYPIPSYQWRKNNAPVSGARSSSYTFTATQTTAGVYTVTAINDYGSALSAPATVTVKPVPHGNLVGTFQGLIERSVGLNQNLGSSLQLTTTSSGAFSGKIVTGTKSVAISGVMTTSFADPTIGTISVAVPALSADLDLTIDTSTDTVSGTLSDGLSSSASVSGWRNGWATVVGNAAKVKGLYSFCLNSGTVGADVPKGYGFGSFTVAEKTGLLTLKGVLPDGSKLVSSAFVGQSGQVLLYAPLYGNQGSLAGVLNITQALTAPVGNTLEGTASWLKPDLTGKSKDTAYRSGFEPIELSAAGAIYTPIAKGERVLGLAIGNNNAELVFTEGGLDATFTQSVTIANPSLTGVANKVTLSGAVNSLLLPTLTPATGAFTGSFTLAATPSVPARKASFSGQIVTVAGVPKGYGFFLLPKVPLTGETVSTAPKLSGAVVLEEVP